MALGVVVLMVEEIAVMTVNVDCSEDDKMV